MYDPFLEEVQEEWKRANIINFLQKNKEELNLDNDDIQTIEKKKISGLIFLDLSQEKLEGYGLQPGPADTIAKLVKKIKGEEQGIYFLGDKEQGTILYICKCYLHLIDIVFNEKIHRCRITDKIKSLCTTKLVNIQFSSTSNIPSVVIISLTLKNTWITQMSEFDKMVGTTIRFMPVWSWNEINECRIGMFNHLEVEKVEDLYSCWGGIPRFILEKALDSSQQNHLEDAISKCNARLLEFVGEIDHADDISHRIIHIHTNLPSEEGEENEETPYIKKFILFASERVAEKVIDKLERNYNQQLRNFVTASSSENEYSMLRGVIFEQIAHRILQKGGSFYTRSLESDFTSTIEIPGRIKLLFNDINKIEEGKYCQLIQKNFSSIDAIVAPHTLFQMTVSRNHPINVNGMKKLVEKLGGKSGTNHIYFYFVLPKDLYDNYQAQPFYTNGQTVAKRIPCWITNRVKQYALKIDLSSW
ncbi:17223_t:CDS:2 [Gigaspora margarita]|uniref:17223_t:CDS:1 n=1 Tax=Gigaspora margarita TaxID=4874 RepID=A0ABN7VJF4_GIGMA|nr:17223_t:CDS:2 [Gigaspora margarita]